MKKDAVIDLTKQYRYWLLREWDASLPKMVFVMLNPSTADADVDDPTIRRCISFARKLDYGSIQVVNLFAFRATDPEGLKDKTINAIWDLNDKYIIETCENADMIVAAWGVNGKLYSRDIYVEKLIGTNTFDLHCLGVSAKGYPRHPLFVSGEVKPIIYKEKKFQKIISVIPTINKKIVSREGYDPKTMSDYEFHRDVLDE